MLCGLQETNGEVKLGFNGDLYPSAGASVVMSTKGDMVDYDTSRQRLGIGSANQILQVKSSLPSWETVDLADTVLTTAGDVLFENATPELARLAAGTQYNNLQMGSALPAWASSSTSVLTGAMDILYASSANTLARLSAGTSGDVLTTKGTGSAPVWETPSTAGVTTNRLSDIQTTNVTTTATGYESAGISITLSNQTGGNADIQLFGSAKMSISANEMYVTISDDGGSTDAKISTYNNDAVVGVNIGIPYKMATDGSAIDVLIAVSAGTGTIFGSSGSNYRWGVMVSEVY